MGSGDLGASARSLDWPIGGGEMGALIRAHDWATTPLGRVETWPPSLRAAADLCLGSAFPMIVLWGPDLVQVYNDGYRVLMGIKHPAGLGQATRDCWPEVWHINEPIYARVRAGETLTFADALYPTTRSGALEDAWFSLCYSPLHDEAGAIAGVLVTVFETTERHLAEVAREESDRTLRVSEARQTFLLHLSDALRPLADPVAIQDTATRVLGEHLDVDRTYYVEIDDARQVAVVARDYVRGEAPSLVGEHPLAPFGSMLRVIRAGQPFVAADAETDPTLRADLVDYRARALRAFVAVPLIKEGALVAAMCVTSAAPRRWTDGEVALVEETAERTWAALREAHGTLERRVSERTAELAAAVEGLRTNEGRLRLLLQQMPAALWTTNREMRVTTLTGALVPTLPSALRDAVGRTVLDLFPPTGSSDVDADAVASPMAAHRQALGGASVGFDVEVEGRTYSAHVEPLSDASGGIIGVIGVAHDVTDRTLLRLQDEFLALAIHELRTPLTPARGYLEMLPRALATGNSERAARYAALAFDQMRRLDGLVSDLLDVGRLRGGKLRLEMAEVDLAEVTRRAREAGQIEAGTQAIVLDAPLDAVNVHGDAVRLEQVVLNLITNAIKYAPGSETIDVRLRATDGEAVLSVSDTGAGIAAADLPHLFSRFYQVEQPNRPSRGGLGLGLYLVKELVEAHGGAVAVASILGQGTIFTVRLPLMGTGGEKRDASAQ